MNIFKNQNQSKNTTQQLIYNPVINQQNPSVKVNFHKRDLSNQSNYQHKHKRDPSLT
jgi:hypothetical protein